MAQTVTQFPPSIIAEIWVKFCQLVAQMEAKALHVQNQARASGFPFHNFSSFSSFDYQVACCSCHGNVPPTSCQSSAQMLSSPSPTTNSCSHMSPSERTPTPTPPQNGKEGRSSANDEFGPNTSRFADEFKLKWLVYLHFWVMVIADCKINKTMLNIFVVSVRHSLCSVEIGVCHRLQLQVVVSSFISVKIKWKMCLETQKIPWISSHSPSNTFLSKWSSILRLFFSWKCQLHLHSYSKSVNLLQVCSLCNNYAVTNYSNKPDDL